MKSYILCKMDYDNFMYILDNSFIYKGRVISKYHWIIDFHRRACTDGIYMSDSQFYTFKHRYIKVFGCDQFHAWLVINKGTLMPDWGINLMHDPDECEGLTQSEFKLWLRLFYEEMHPRGIVTEPPSATNMPSWNSKYLFNNQNYMTDEMAVCGRIALSNLKVTNMKVLMDGDITTIVDALQAAIAHDNKTASDDAWYAMEPEGLEKIYAALQVFGIEWGDEAHLEEEPLISKAPDDTFNFDCPVSELFK